MDTANPQVNPTPNQPQGTLAALTYFVFFAPNLAGKATNPFVHYHQRQAVGLALFGLVLQGIITVIGWWLVHLHLYSFVLPRLMVWAVRIVLICLALIGTQKAMAGEMAELPYIGKYATRLNIPS